MHIDILSGHIMSAFFMCKGVCAGFSACALIIFNYGGVLQLAI